MSFDALDISASALNAQRTKMDTIASNIANINTTRGPDGTKDVYRRKDAVFASVYNESLSSEKGSGPIVSSGVKILEIAEDTQTPLKKVYNPAHPDANEDGYVDLPNVNIVNEMVDMITASRAYEANVTAINATKSMVSSAMKI
ncbi:MAG: flagellar basal body rod protein FlgC [Candidatus Melainabacteria bacterium GWF2_37_15]|nr:MAG: flagellar basal body rod protein FlgC [Candidatus Melainabacteria bacterium GWF2_37_15]